MHPLRPGVIAAVAVFPDVRFVAAARPLMAAGVVEGVSWTVDACGFTALPASFAALLDTYATEERLFGHALGLSCMSAGDEVRRDAWLSALARDPWRGRYRHVTDHFGVSFAPGWRAGPPLPTPLSPALARSAAEALKAMRDAVEAPVGLENLALAFSRDEAAQQGEMLEAILAPVDGVLLLDLHNLYCQIQNFGLVPADALARLPLARVRELHVSGGCDKDGLRRDTHDGRVPAGVWRLLDLALARCPDVEVVTLEQVPEALGTATEQAGFRDDYAELVRRLEDTWS